MNTWIDAGTLVLATAGGWIGILSYRQGLRDRAEAQRASTEAARREYERPFYEHQLRLYLEAVAVVARVATAADDSAARDAERRFWELYWGEMSLVEDEPVARKMVEVGALLGRTSAPAGAGAPTAVVARAANELAVVLRDSLRRAWPVPPRTAPS